MRNFRNVALGLLGAAAVASASDVHDLKKDTFGEFIKSHDLVLAEFFAPWCGHCKSLAPEYEIAATSLKEKDIPLVKVDCTEEADLCKEYGVEGYPTVKVFRGPDNISAYTGPRKAPAIISYMTKQSLPPVSTITPEAIEEFKTADKVVLVAYFAADDKTSNATFTEVAKALRDDYLFGAASDPELAKAEGVKQPAIVLYKTFDEGKDIFQEKFETAAITKFVKVAATPLVGDVGPDTYQGYMDAGIPLAYIFAETAEERASFAEMLKPVATKHKGVVNFATIDAKAFGAHASNLNLVTDKWPAFAIQNVQANLKYPFDQSKTITEKDIAAFVDEFAAGTLKPSIKSEAIPEKNDGPVKVIVAHTYDEIVMDDNKDVLVEFYAPWCGHCKALAPKYEELGSLYANNPEFAKKVTIAKVDATQNDTPEDVQGFPTLKLFKAGDKKNPVVYEGDRSLNDLVRFVKESGKWAVDASTASASKGDAEKADAESLGQAAAAATEAATEAAGNVADAVKSAASGAASVVEAVVGDNNAGAPHDEL